MREMPWVEDQVRSRSLRARFAESMPQGLKAGFTRIRSDAGVKTPAYQNPPKIKKRATGPGVEGYPETVCPLDPGPGLGGTVSLGLFPHKSRQILRVRFKS